MPINPKIIIEQIEKQNRSLVLCDNYRINPKLPSVTNKFYAHHDVLNLNKADPEILKNILTVKSFGPTQKYKRPITTSHSYGWFSKPLIDTNRNDRRLYRPCTTTPMVKVGELIAAAHITARPKFTGITFKLQ